jgi:PAS domain S-box-containing protein
MPETLPHDQIVALQARLADAENTLRAIRHGEVDAITVSMPNGEQVYSLSSVERVYRDMIETMGESALNVTPEGMILYCNQRFATMIKAELPLVMGSNLLTYFDESDRAAISSLFDDKMVGVRRVHARLRGMDGLVLSVNVATYVRNHDDQPCTIITIITDLTEMLAAQAATLAALRYARDLIEAILDPLTTIDINGKITDVNRATGTDRKRFCRLLYRAAKGARVLRTGVYQRLCDRCSPDGQSCLRLGDRDALQCQPVQGR